jgi:hypothetical protein
MSSEKELYMKKIIVVLLITVFSASAFAQVEDLEISVSGLGKSGIYWQKEQREGFDPEEKVNLHSKDDAGNNEGRFRLNLDFTRDNMGIRTRWQWDNWGQGAPQWAYAFIYGNFFDNQLTTSVGKLGESPWATGGPEMWKELEITARQTGGGIGMRTEYKPFFVPGLNVGFVLNFFNNAGDQGWPEGKPYTLLEILKETVIGVAYVHDYFLVRFAFRFDSVADAIAGNTGGVGEQEYVYRVEERVLSNFLPGFQIWALGYGVGLTAPKEHNTLKLENWLFTQYDPELFTAQIRFGYDSITDRGILHLRPSFYWKFFNNLLNLGVMFYYSQDFGEGKVYAGSPFLEWQIEPKIQVNFGNSNNYFAFAYNFGRTYIQPYDLPDGTPYDGVPLKQTQWMNLRFCLQL